MVAVEVEKGSLDLWIFGLSGTGGWCHSARASRAFLCLSALFMPVAMHGPWTMRMRLPLLMMTHTDDG